MFYHEQRQRLADRLIQYPLVSFLLMSPWFVATMLLFGFLTTLGAVAIPRIWVTSPPGFLPLVQISLIDRVQAWALRRNALDLEAAGDQIGAHKAWSGAIANNPADVTLLRASLRHTAQTRSEGRPTDAEVFTQIGWLFRLAGTNRQDVGLAAQATEAIGLARPAFELLSPHFATLSAPEHSAYLRALFLLGHAADFERQWSNAPAAAKTAPETAVCRMAYEAGWGDPNTLGENRRSLALALEDPKRWIIACRANMVLCAHVLDADGYASALHRLEIEKLDRLAERLRYWRLLESVGRKPEALRLAAAAILPQSAQDTLDLLQAYSSLGMADESVGLIQRSLPKFGTDPSSAGIKLWMASVNTLVEAHRWDDLSSLALGMRDAGENTAVLTGVNRFAEGRVLMARGHEESAESFFHEAARLAWPEPAFALQAATAMLRLNQPHPALEMLVRFEEPLHTNAVYWQTVFETAYALKEDSALLLKAASLARDLKPTDTATRANYAAALLINRQSADEASKITLTFLQSNPNSLVAKVNHSFALAMNRRGDEATTLLRTLDPTRLGDLELSVYHLCWLEIESQRQDWPACQTHIGKINRKFLFPSQIRWLDDVHGQATSTR